jgi:uncharacterized protein
VSKIILKELFNKIKTLAIDPLVKSQNPPWLDARGVSMGLIIGTAIPIGMQTAFMVLLRLLVRFNVLIAFAFTWVNNPLTLAPMYYIFYLIGSISLGKTPAKNFQDFQVLFKPIIEADGLREVCAQLLTLGGDFLSRWFVGAFVSAIPLGLTSYFISLRFLKSRQQKKALLQEAPQNLAIGKN